MEREGARGREREREISEPKERQTMLPKRIENTPRVSAKWKKFSQVKGGKSSQPEPFW